LPTRDDFLSQQKLKKLPSFKAFEIVSHLPLFSDLTPEENRLIANNQNLFYFIPEGDEFIVEGELDNCFYLLLSGKARVVQTNVEYDELTAGDVVGVIGFVKDQARTASVIALNDILAMKFSRFQFKKLPANVRELIKDHMMEELVKRIDRLNKQFHPK